MLFCQVHARQPDAVQRGHAPAAAELLLPDLLQGRLHRGEGLGQHPCAAHRCTCASGLTAHIVETPGLQHSEAQRQMVLEGSSNQGTCTLLQGIFDTLKECAAISKSAGGIGLSIHNIRATVGNSDPTCTLMVCAAVLMPVDTSCLSLLLLTPKGDPGTAGQLHPRHQRQQQRHRADAAGVQ